MKIAVIDYGMGNLRSVQKAFQCIGYDAVVTADSKVIADASHIVLPGVGAFKDAMDCINNSGVRESIDKSVNAGKPLLGICLGMQMLFDTSSEDGVHDGLKILNGDIVRFDIDLKVPHIGWNKAEPITDSRLYKGIEDKYFYFVHSYYLDRANANANALTEYQIEFACSVERDNVFGVQYHPEKSGDTGLKLLKNFGGIR